MQPRVTILLFVLLLPLPGLGQNGFNASPSQAIQSALRAHDFAQALQLATSGVQQFPRDAKLWTLQGIAFSGLGKDREALAAYDKSLSISADYLPALEGAAELEYKVGSPHAIPHLNRILQQMPNDATSHAMLAVLAYKQHDCTTAVKHFAQSTQLIVMQPAALAEYGSCLMDLDRAHDAIPVFQQLVAQFPENPHARLDLAGAQVTVHQGKEAVKTLQPLLEVKPPDSDTLDLASSAYEEEGNTPKAVELLRQAIVTNPKKIRYYLDFATLSFNHQSFQVGIDMVNVGLKESPKAAPSISRVAFSTFSSRTMTMARLISRPPCTLTPARPRVPSRKEWRKYKQSNLDQALTTVQSQLKSHPRDAFLEYLKAQILVQKGASTGARNLRKRSRPPREPPSSTQTLSFPGMFLPAST